MKRCLLVLFFLATLATLSCFAVDVFDVHAQQSGEYIVVHYDLQVRADSVILEYSLDGGGSFQQAKSVMLDPNDLNYGRHKQLTWDMPADVGYIDVDDLVVRVRVHEKSQFVENETPFALTPKPMVYRKKKVYMGDRDMTDEYLSFIARQNPEAYKSYCRSRAALQAVGGIVMTAGVGCLLSGLYYTIGGMSAAKDSEYDFMGTAKNLYIAGGVLFVASIPILAEVRVAPTKRLIKRYNAGLESATLAAHNQQPVLLQLGGTGKGLGLAVVF